MASHEFSFKCLGLTGLDALVYKISYAWCARRIARELKYDPITIEFPNGLKYRVEKGVAKPYDQVH